MRLHAEGREIVRNSFAGESTTCEPQDPAVWQDALIKWQSLRK